MDPADPIHSLPQESYLDVKHRVKHFNEHLHSIHPTHRPHIESSYNKNSTHKHRKRFYRRSISNAVIESGKSKQR